MIYRLLIAAFSVVVFTGALPGWECLAASDPAGKPDTGHADLIEAAASGDCATVEKLIEKGADVNAQADDGATALLLVARGSCIDACRKLLEIGADPDARTRAGETPLLVAASYGHTAIMRLLAENGADTLAATANGATALFYATYKDDTATVNAIFELSRSAWDKAGVPAGKQYRLMAGYINTQDQDGYTPLMNAAWNGNAGLVRMLLDMGADPGVRDKRGNTARMMAARNNKPEVEKILLDAEKAVEP